MSVVIQYVSEANVQIRDSGWRRVWKARGDRTSDKWCDIKSLAKVLVVKIYML